MYIYGKGSVDVRSGPLSSLHKGDLGNHWCGTEHLTSGHPKMESQLRSCCIFLVTQVYSWYVSKLHSRALPRYHQGRCNSSVLSPNPRTHGYKQDNTLNQYGSHLDPGLIPSRSLSKQCRLIPGLRAQTLSAPKLWFDPLRLSVTRNLTVTSHALETCAGNVSD